MVIGLGWCSAAMKAMNNDKCHRSLFGATLPLVTWHLVPLLNLSEYLCGLAQMKMMDDHIGRHLSFVAEAGMWHLVSMLKTM